MGKPEDIPAEIRDQLPKKVWKSHKTRAIVSQLKELRSGVRERRGATEKYDREALIRFYIEVEAIARWLTGGVVSNLFDHTDLRVEESDGSRRRLNRKDKQKLRRRHSEGYREARVWKDITFMGLDDRPHPTWSEIQRSIERREAQLRSSDRSLVIFSQRDVTAESLLIRGATSCTVFIERL
jgi:hypothetical protein